MNASASRLLAGALTLALAAGCASAGKRLEQGLEAEAKGDYHAAVSRYIEALEKDATLTDAHDALLVAWDSASARGRRAAGEASARGDAEGAAAEWVTLDRLMARARRVEVMLPTPDAYAARRRESLDAAIAALMVRGDTLRRDGRWRDAQNAYRRVMDDMDPLDAQRRAARDAQAEALLEWAEAEAREGRPRAAFGLADEALAVGPEIPPGLAAAATRLQDRALGEGLRILAVFPVGSTAEVRRASLAELDAQLSDVLETEHWRRPPLFVAVADPARVRQVTRRFSPPGAALETRRILEELGADFGALVELVDLQATERDVKRSSRSGRTKDGRAVTYSVEEGRISYALAAEVTIFDKRGRSLESFTVRNAVSDGFRRASYEGTFEDLDLSQGERLLFNPGEERRQRAALQESMLGELAADAARETYERVVRRIP
jgi:tetratricopeptide (TPR) repeat protein